LSRTGGAAGARRAVRILRARSVAAGVALFLASAVALLATNFMQPGFSESVVFTGLTNPTVVRFLPDGSVLVAEKGGLLKLFPNLTTNSYTVVADLTPEVHNFWDRGMLGMAVDPNFATNHYVYVLYAYDAPIGGAPPTWGDACPSPPGATTDGCVVSGRLTRLTALGSDWSASETPLVNDWCQQFPSHSIGSLEFGADGYLYVSGGDGASWTNADWGQFGGTSGSPPPTPANPCGDPPFPAGTPQTKPTAEGGALRSQSHLRTTGEPRVLNGAILRLDPATGLAAPDNPLIGSGDLNEQRIIGYGFRNPFRMTVRPGTNEVWVSDVGWTSREEINRIPDLSTVRNFGWPCYEGLSVQYQGLDICPAQADTTAPFFFYQHSLSVVPGDGCPTGSSSVAGLTFYQGGSNYPSNYGNALFFSDYSRKCMWVMFPNAAGDPVPSPPVCGATQQACRAAFANTAAGPVHLTIGPNGNLFYVDFDGGQILEVKYGLAAIATAAPTSGDAPLTVDFDGTGSIAAQPGDTLSYAWDLDGDGEFDDSTDPKPSFTYNNPGTYTVRLKVTDQRGGSAISDPITISPGNTPPTAFVDTPAASLMWKVGDPIAFSGHATDAQDGTLGAAALSWQVIIHHCPSTCHTHLYETFPGVASGSFPAPDHDYPSYLEIALTATDSQGQTNTASVSINPLTASLNFQTNPTGLQLSVGSSPPQATPFSQTVIVNSVNAVQALSPQGTLPNIWEFWSWSDGGAQNHNVTAPAGSSTYTATYLTHADLSIGQSAPATVCAGQALSYTLNVVNAGPSTAFAVTVTDVLPSGASLDSAGGTGWSCSGTTTVTCTAASLAPGAAPAITITARAPGTTGPAVDSASVASATDDPFSPNNSSDATTTVDALEPPTVTAATWAPVGATGVAANVPEHDGSTYDWTLAGGTITGGQGSAAITLDAGDPGTTMVLQVTESNATCTSSPGSARIQVDFLDVPPAHLFHDFVDRIARDGVTAGCGGGSFCPDAPNTRAQMAVFLLKSKYGSDHVPPPATGSVFLDVPASDAFAPWIEELAGLGVTGGCGGGNYCPGTPVTRAQMAVFLLKTLEGSAYAPPPATGTVFGDVPADAFAAAWIEELASRSVTGGCQASPPLYCPGAPNTRGQMAVFLIKTFSLP
jgi:uncharacterized repeat protein (TIGR01451 family)